MNRHSLSLCMIVRDEAQMLPDCLRSARAAADEIIVVDTGSTDETPNVALQFGARLIRHEWHDDFSEVRNASIETAGSDWILWLDADERLRPEEAPQIRAAMETTSASAYLVPILNQTPHGAHISRGHRLFRNGRGIRFSGRIHEQISPSLPPGAEIATARFMIDHLGYALAAEKLQRKNERNLRMLRDAKAANPRDAYVRFTLGQMLLIMNELAQAEHEINVALGFVARERIERPLPPDLRAAGLNNLAECALRRGAPAEALAHCRESLHIVPEQVTAHLVANKASTMMGDDASALRELDAAVRLVEDSGQGGKSAIEVTVNAGDLRRAMGYCCLRMGRLEEAQSHFNKALIGDTRPNETLAGLARCALAQGNTAEATSLVDQALALAPEDDVLLDLSSLLLLKTGQFEAAAEQIGRLCLRRPDDLPLRKRLAGVLVKLGRSDAALAVLGGALDGLSGSEKS